jgi:hypothetical protein
MVENENTLIEICKESVNKASHFLEIILKPPLQELGLLVQDRVKLWRFKQQVNIINNAKVFLDKKGISPQKVPLKVLVPLLENGSLEEDFNMQQKWSSLLASAADPSNNNIFILQHIEILNQISSVEAKVLDMIYDYHWTKTMKTGGYKERDEIIMKETCLLFEDYHILLSALIRLGVIEETIGERTIDRQATNVPKFHMIKGPTELTDLGYYFVKNCRKID